MNITVYLGANEGNDNRLREAVQARLSLKPAAE